MSSKRQYNALLKEAETAESEGEWRLAADKYLQAVVKAPSAWAPHRWQAFINYSNMWQQHSLEMTCQEWKCLKRISKHSEEPVLFRCMALYLRGLVQMKADAGEMEDAAMYFRRALHTMTTGATLSSENNEKVNVNVGGTQVLLSARDELSTLKPMIHENLQLLEQADNVDAAVLQSVPRGVGGRPDPDIVQRLTVGGTKCDACHTTRSTDEEELLQRCSRCKRAYYCSKTCQQRQWNAGHYLACRMPREIQPNDYMTLKGLLRRPDLNGKVVQVKQPANDNRWAVSIRGQGNTLSIAAQNLVHIRPEM